jgi:hypothetical protein
MIRTQPRGSKWQALDTGSTPSNTKPNTKIASDVTQALVFQPGQVLVRIKTRFPAKIPRNTMLLATLSPEPKNAKYSTRQTPLRTVPWATADAIFEKNPRVGIPMSGTGRFSKVREDTGCTRTSSNKM